MERFLQALKDKQDGYEIVDIKLGFDTKMLANNPEWVPPADLMSEQMYEDLAVAIENSVEISPEEMAAMFS